MGAQITKIAVFLAGSLALATPDVRAFTITEWGLSTGVRRYTPYTADWDHWTTVVNPLNVTQTAVLGDSQSGSTLDFAWGETFGTFLVQSEQEAVGLSGSEVGTISAGFIHVFTTEPLPLHIVSSWSYNLPRDWMMTYMGVNVRAADSSDVLFSQEYLVQTAPWEPASGTLTIQGDVTLTPGQTWIMAYSLWGQAFSGTQGYSATGNGFVEFTITPEVSSLTMLAAASLVVLRRRTRRSC